MPTLEDDKVKREDQIDERANERFNDHPDLQEHEQNAGELSNAQSGIDQSDAAYANDSDDASKNLEQVENTKGRQGLYRQTSKKSQNDDSSLGDKIKLQIKKRGPAGGIVGLLVAALMGVVISLPGLLLVHVKETLTNYGSSASRAADERFENSLFYRLAGTTEQACKNSGSVSKIRCKRGTLTEKNYQKLKDNGFDVKSKKVGDRYVITSISKDGQTIDGKSSRAKIKNAMRHPGFGSSMNKAINPRTNVFNKARFPSIVLKKLGIDKSKVDIAGSTDEERRENFTKAVGGDKTKADIENDLADKKKQIADNGKKVGKSAATIPLSGACATYNISRGIIGAVKLYNKARLALFAKQFLTAADQIKATGDVEPETIATLGAILTSYHTSGPSKGLTATDSQGFKVAAYGGEGALQSFTRNFVLGGNTKLLTIDKLVTNTQKKVGKKNIKVACKAINNPLAQLLSGVTLGCGPGASLFAAAGSIVPVLGTAAGAATGCILGAVTAITGGAFLVNKLVGKVMDTIFPKVVAMLANSTPTSELKGVDAGNALATGAGVIMEETNASRGLQPGTKDSVARFQQDADEYQKNYETIARYDARDEPFDIYNEYSFLGSAVRKSGIITTQPSSFLGGISTLGTIFSSATNLTPSVSAAGTMPLSLTKEDLSHCPDETLQEAGIDCDAVGGIQFTMDTKIPVKENLSFMIGKYVDEDGGVIHDDYDNWVKYCTDQREDSFGIYSGPAEEENSWNNGDACVAGSSEEINQTTRDNFSAYYYDNGAQEDEEYESSEDSAASTEVDGGVGISSDGFVFPLKTTKGTITGDSSAWCSESQENCHHDYNAADIFAPTGTDVIAARAGTVASAKDNDGSSVGARVTIKGNDGNLYYYAHMGWGTIVVSTGDNVLAGDKLGQVGIDKNAVDTHRHLHFDTLPSSYNQRVLCSGASCTEYPFINVQPALTNAFKELPD